MNCCSCTSGARRFSVIATVTISAPPWQPWVFLVTRRGYLDNAGHNGRIKCDVPSLRELERVAGLHENLQLNGLQDRVNAAPAAPRVPIHGKLAAGENPQPAPVPQRVAVDPDKFF